MLLCLGNLLLELSFLCPFLLNSLWLCMADEVLVGKLLLRSGKQCLILLYLSTETLCLCLDINCIADEEERLETY